MTKRFDNKKYVQDVHDLANATIDYLDHQCAVNHPDQDQKTSMSMAGTAAIAAGLSILIGGVKVDRKALAVMISKQMDLAYSAIRDEEPPEDTRIH